MSLLTAVQQAVYEIGTGTVPTSVIGNTDAQVAQILAIATREGREFHDYGMQWGGWPECRKENTFNLIPVGPYTGDMTSGNTTIANMSSVVGLVAGYGITAAGLFANTTIVSVGANSIVVSQAPTITQTAVSMQFGQIAYSLPSDFKFFLSATQWDRNFRWQMLGPLSAQEWQTIVSGISPVGPRLRFRVMGNPLQMWIQPTPGQSQTDTIAFEYISSAWCQSAGGTLQTAWTLDTDTYLWDEDLLTLGIIWRFKRAKGLDYAEERRMYDDRVSAQMARSGGNRSLPLNASAGGIRLISNNQIPDTGFGT